MKNSSWHSKAFLLSFYRISQLRASLLAFFLWPLQMPAFLQYHSPFVGEKYFAFMLQWNRRTNRETATTSEQQQQTQKGKRRIPSKCHQSNPDKTRGRFWWSLRSCKKRTTNYKPWVQGLYVLFFSLQTLWVRVFVFLLTCRYSNYSKQGLCL